MKNYLKAIDRVFKDTPILVPESGVSVSTLVDGNVNVTTITLAAGTVIGSVAAANKAFGTKLLTFPKGRLVVYHVAHSISLTAHTGCTVDPDTGIGTVVASGAATVIGGTATFEDILNGSAWGALTEGVAKLYEGIATGEADSKDGRTTACAAFLNMAGAWATTGTIVGTGTITIVWAVLS